VATPLALAPREPWWDTVDGMAAVVGAVVRRQARSDEQAQRAMDAASVDRRMWARRIAMIHQLG